MRADDVLPDDVGLADLGGMPVRKGTVAAFLYNARVWSDPGTSQADRIEVERNIVEALPALHATGLFEVLSPRDAKLAALVGAR